MNVMVIGGGGREHALVWKLTQSSRVKQLLWTPGNPAAPVGSKVSLHGVGVEDLDGLVKLAVDQRVDLVVIGPEGPLVLGLSDRLRAKGIKVFGPGKQGAQLEGSKVFSKEFFVRHHIPTGRAESFTDPEKAIRYALQQPRPVVIKADGLAAGKGVLICHEDQEIREAIQDILVKRVFGDAGNRILVEEGLQGEELSVHAITDGKQYQLLASAQDHKRALDGDLGLNTGGMGTYSPTSTFTPELEATLRRDFFDRTLAGFQKDGISFCGVLYAGLMLTQEGPRILEYNCRLGDPETQVILPRMKNDLLEVLLAACEGRLGEVKLEWHDHATVCVVLASAGYPGSYRKGDVIEGLNAIDASRSVVFHAGTTQKNGQPVTSGGRVLGVTAWGSNLRAAVDTVYQSVDQIKFQGMRFRRDIAEKGLHRTAGKA